MAGRGSPGELSRSPASHFFRSTYVRWFARPAPKRDPLTAKKFCEVYGLKPIDLAKIEADEYWERDVAAAAKEYWQQRYSHEVIAVTMRRAVDTTLPTPEHIVWIEAAAILCGLDIHAGDITGVLDKLPPKADPVKKKT